MGGTTRNAVLGSVMNFLNRILEQNEDMISEKVRETEYDVNQGREWSYIGNPKME